jgi:hypothetical protein
MACAVHANKCVQRIFFGTFSSESPGLTRLESAGRIAERETPIGPCELTEPDIIKNVDIG